MIHRFVFHNDRVQPVDEVRLSPGQAGLLNGWGLFTTARIYEGIPFAFERHWQRLQRDAQRTHCPFPFQESVVHGQLQELLRANKVSEGAARVYVVYNQVGFWRSDENFPRVDLILCSADLPSYREPARLGLREHGRYAASPLAGVKVLSWLDNVWNYYEAQQAGFDEVVLLNERGEVAECTAANIFCVKGGRGGDAPGDCGMPARDHAQRAAGNWGFGGRAGGGANAAARGFVRGRRGFHIFDQSQHAGSERNCRPQDCRRPWAGYVEIGEGVWRVRPAIFGGAFARRATAMIRWTRSHHARF